MGVTVETLQPGDGKNFPKPGGTSVKCISKSHLVNVDPDILDKVKIHYVGTLASNGKQFDSSRDRNKPFETVIGVGQVIKGWDEGVPQLSVGQKAILKITSDYGYGARGVGGGLIPPNSDLNFEVELLSIN